MNKQAPSLARIMTMVLVALSCFGLFVFLWVAFGGPTPLKADGYRFTVPFKEAGQLAQEADVRISGVRVGTVKSITTDPVSGSSKVVVQMLPQYSPVAQDSRAMLRAKSLLGENYLELTPGNPDGPFVADNGTLPQGNIKPSVELDEIFRAFDPKTREAFDTWQQQLAIAGTGYGRDLNDAFALLAPLEEQAASLGKVLNRNQAALSSLVHDTGVVFSALSARGNEFASLIVNSNRVFSTTAAANQQLADTFVALPTFQRETRATHRARCRLDRTQRGQCHGAEGEERHSHAPCAGDLLKLCSGRAAREGEAAKTHARALRRRAAAEDGQAHHQVVE